MSEIDRIRQRLARATPGVWITAPGSIFEARVISLSGEATGETYRNVIEDDEASEGDLAFIAYAKQDMAMMLAVLDAAQEEIERLRFQLAHANNLIDAMCYADADTTPEPEDHP